MAKAIHGYLFSSSPKPLPKQNKQDLQSREIVTLACTLLGILTIAKATQLTLSGLSAILLSPSSCIPVLTLTFAGAFWLLAYDCYLLHQALKNYPLSQCELPKFLEKTILISPLYHSFSGATR